MTNRLEMIENRKDISPFMVHLTRDDRNTDPNGSTARENFLQMLGAGEVSAVRPHGLYANRLPEFHQKKFRVSCYTECPLSQIAPMVGETPGRRYQFEAYGFVFARELLIERGAQPVTYVNSYGDDQGVREGWDDLFEICLKRKFTGSLWKPLASVSAMHEKCDFAWEREWRLRGSLAFDPGQIVCAIVPEKFDLELRKKLGGMAIPMYSPGWDFDRIILESSKQQQRVKRLAAQPSQPAAKPFRRVTP